MVQQQAFITREQWLQSAIDRMRNGIAATGLKLPATIHVSIGFPSVRALSTKNRRVGECWPCKASKDGNPHVYISPLLKTGVDVLATLLHELIHAAGVRGHKADFRRPAVAMGLEGPMTSTVPSQALLARLNVMETALGPYPHSGLDFSARETKKQTTRLLKAECPCGAIIRVTQKVVDSPGLPTCACGGEFELSD